MEVQRVMEHCLRCGLPWIECRSRPSCTPYVHTHTFCSEMCSITHGQLCFGLLRDPCREPCPEACCFCGNCVEGLHV